MTATATDSRPRTNSETTDRNWISKAACQGHIAFRDAALDYEPVSGLDPHTDEKLTSDMQAVWQDRKAIAEAACKEVCATCPVIDACRRDALRQRIAGVAGGLTEQERQNMTTGTVTMNLEVADQMCDRDNDGRINDSLVAKKYYQYKSTCQQIAFDLGCSTRTVTRSLARVRAAAEALGVSVDELPADALLPSPPQPAKTATVTPRTPRTSRASSRVVELPPDEILNAILDDGKCDKQHTKSAGGAAVWDELALAFESRTNGGWVDRETLVAAASPFISDDEAFHEFARVNLEPDEPVVRLKDTAQRIPLEQRLDTAKRAIVGNYLQGYVKKGQVERYQMPGKATWYRLKRKPAQMWLPSVNDPDRVTVERDYNKEEGIARRALAAAEASLAAARVKVDEAYEQVKKAAAAYDADPDSVTRRDAEVHANTMLGQAVEACQQRESDVENARAEHVKAVSKMQRQTNVGRSMHDLHDEYDPVDGPAVAALATARPSDDRVVRTA